jgi:hypothetical protein
MRPLDRPCVGLCVAAALVLLLGCGSKQKQEQKQEKPGLPAVREHTVAPDESAVVVEAESAAVVETPMKVVDDVDASGGKCLAIPGGSGRPGGKNPADDSVYPDRWGAAVFTFTVKAPGKYRFWGRKFWEGGCGNSLTLVMNGGPPAIFGEDGTYDDWQWKTCVGLFDLRAGENKLEVLNREDGVKLDKFILTTDMDFVPQGKE